RGRALEGVDAHLAEVASPAPVNLVHCDLEAQSLAVEALGRHRVERVGDVDDPCGERDLVSQEAVGIAAPVGPLVVMANAWHNLAEEAGLLDDPRAELW